MTFGSASRPRARHHSYFAKRTRTDSARLTPSGSEAHSLLSHTQITESARKENLSGKSHPELHEVRGQQSGSVQDVSGQSSGVSTDLAVLLKLILYQSLESAADVRWELRRMGKQVQWNLGIRDTQGTVKNCPQF